MKHNIYFLIGLFLLLSLLFFSLSVKALTDLTPACNNEIANSVNNPSYPDVCEVRSQSLDPVTCCSSKEFNGLSTVSFMDSLGFKVSIGWFVLCPQKTVTFNGVSAASSCIAQVNTLCGLVNSGETTCSLPQSSVCCAATSGFSSPIPTPTPTPTSVQPTSDTITSETIQSLAIDLENVVELDNQALQKIDDGMYIEADPIIDSAIQSLNNIRDSLGSDSNLSEFRENEPKAVSKIDRGLKSSISNHKRASSSIKKIINNPKVEENKRLLLKFLKKTKDFLLNGRRFVQNTSNAVTSVRG